jgi:hypothetical protein
LVVFWALSAALTLATVAMVSVVSLVRILTRNLVLQPVAYHRKGNETKLVTTGGIASVIKSVGTLESIHSR